jgi:hypothetical protein
MIIHFKFGFEFNGLMYGWHKKELYRLPTTKNNRHYTLMKVGRYANGYYVGRRMKSDAIVKSMTRFINVKVEIIEDDQMPF